LSKELIVMGGSINPRTDNPEFALSPSHEFNFWMDPEASSAVLHAPWPRVVVTTVDISVKTLMDKELIEQIRKSPTPAAQYVAKYASANFLWDELAAVAWLDPSIITKWKKLYMDVNNGRGAGYGNTLVWRPGNQPEAGEILEEVQDDVVEAARAGRSQERGARNTSLEEKAAAIPVQTTGHLPRSYRRIARTSRVHGGGSTEAGQPHREMRNGILRRPSSP